MGTISSYSNEFKNAAKQLAKAEKKELLIKTQFEYAHNETNQHQDTYFETGLLYFNAKKRQELLKNAEELCYSKSAIEHLRTFNQTNWNSDSVTLDDIKQLETIERFVSEYTLSWKKNPLTRLGKFVNHSE